jgi:glutathione S-transferase
MIKLYGHATRTAANVLKLRAALAEAGVEYGYVALDLSKGDQRQPEFLAINPHGKVPALVDGDLALAESDAILWYVGEKFPAAAMLPSTCQSRAIVMQWCAFASTGLYTASYDIHVHTTWAEPANRSAFVAERGRVALDRALAVLDKRLSGREFVADAGFSVADYAVAAVVLMIRTRGQTDLAKYSNVMAHLARIEARPAWKQAIGPTP